MYEYIYTYTFIKRYLQAYIYVYYKFLGSYVPSTLSNFTQGCRNSELVASIAKIGGAEGGQSMHRAANRPLQSSLRPSTQFICSQICSQGRFMCRKFICNAFAHSFVYLALQSSTWQSLQQ